jgi:23S rRNA (pseudouridine1915-N3)-methyltransferase
MQITVAHVGPRIVSGDPFQVLTARYLERCVSLARCEAQAFKSEDGLLEWMDRQAGRTPVLPVLLDSRGRTFGSEAFAAWLGARRNDGVQRILFAIGPADGWSEMGRGRAQLLLSLGAFTLAHSLARLVLAEQLYRASTILSGHPYHSGH